LDKKPKGKKSKINNKASGPYVNEDESAPKNKTVMATATEHPKVNVGVEDEVFEPKEWFSNTTYYEYFDQYMIGLDLGGIDFFKNALNW
jgi:hypothetical protein